MYLLDTNACIQVLNGTSPTLIEKLRACHPRDVNLCSIVKAELLFGARKSRRVVHNLALLTAFFEPFHSHRFDDDCAEHYGSIRAELEQQGLPIGANDLAIAAIARSNKLTLVSHNRREFSTIEGLVVEDWETE